MTNTTDIEIRKFLENQLERGKGKDFISGKKDIDDLLKDGFYAKKFSDEKYSKKLKELKNVWGLIIQSMENEFLQPALDRYLASIGYDPKIDFSKKERGSKLEINMLGKKRLGIDRYIEKKQIYIEIKDYHPDRVKAGIAHAMLIDWILLKKKEKKKEDFGVYLAIPYTAGKKIKEFIKFINEKRESKIGLILLREKPQETELYDPKNILNNSD